MKKIIIILLVIAGLFVLYRSMTQSRGASDDQAQIILFHGDGCPHCKIVNDFIKENKVDDKVKIAYKEVYYNKTNQNLLKDTVIKCPEIDSKLGIGVPLAYDKQDNKCYYGDTPIIDHLKAKMLK